jgi:hypothetical protein
MFEVQPKSCHNQPSFIAPRGYSARGHTVGMDGSTKMCQFRQNHACCIGGTVNSRGIWDFFRSDMSRLQPRAARLREQRTFYGTIIRCHGVNILSIKNGSRGTYSNLRFAHLRSTGCDGQLQSWLWSRDAGWSHSALVQSASMCLHKMLSIMTRVLPLLISSNPSFSAVGCFTATTVISTSYAPLAQ